MSKDHWIGIVIILGIVAIALFGGAKNAMNPGATSGNLSLAQKIQNTQTQVENLKTQIQASKYKGLVNLSSISRSTNPGNEYLTIRVSSGAGNIPVTGWMIKSINSGVSVTIPKATYLYFTGMANTEDNIVLTDGDTLYLVTGMSPNGSSFKVNKCSGYLGQFQSFTPYLNANCPAPKEEDLSGIPKITLNDACFDYIDSMSQCRTQTNPLPVNWSFECTNFIYTKINYSSCVNTHKNDADFGQHEWRVYLKRNATLWKDRREDIVLYDNLGKVVDSLTY